VKCGDRNSADRIRFRGHIPVLDGMRGVAILLVLCFHSLRPRADVHGVTLERIYTAIASYGWSGVDLFFILSGFLITGILLDSREAPSYFRNFYIRRTLRIFPLYYAVLFIMFVLAPTTLLGSDGYSVAFRHQYWFWTYTHNFLVSIAGVNVGAFGHFWSLAIEEQFYLFWPLVVRYSPRWWLIRWCTLCIASALALRIILVMAAPSIDTHKLTFTRMDALAFGALVAVLARTNKGLRPVVPWSGPAAIGASVLIGMLALVRWPLSAGDPRTRTFGLTLFAILFSALLVYVISRPSGHVAVQCLEWAPLRFVGKVSYGIYVFHWFIVCALADPWTHLGVPAGLFNQLAFLAVVLLSSLLLASLSWYYYEGRFLALKDRYTSGSPRNRP
jgi:peptidoglycan/LPS O-acetylase OafA/YrhL